MPSTIGKCKLFRIKHITLLEGKTFLRNKHKIAFFEIKWTFFGRKENTINAYVFTSKHIIFYFRYSTFSFIYVKIKRLKKQTFFLSLNFKLKFFFKFMTTNQWNLKFFNKKKKKNSLMMFSFLPQKK